MTDCRVNGDTNAYYNSIEKSEALHRTNGEELRLEELRRVNSRTGEIMGGDNQDLLAEILAENPGCVEALSELCMVSTDHLYDDLKTVQVRPIVIFAQALVRKIEAEVRKGVEAGHYI